MPDSSVKEKNCINICYILVMRWWEEQWLTREETQSISDTLTTCVTLKTSICSSVLQVSRLRRGAISGTFKYK